MLDKLVLGTEYPEVHLVKDKPYRVLGKSHRSLYHTPLDDLLLFSDNPGRLASALLHDLVDKACSKKPELKAVLEALA